MKKPTVTPLLLLDLSTVAQFMHVLRQRIQLGATESIYLMVNGITPTTRSAASAERGREGGRGGHKICFTVRQEMLTDISQFGGLVDV